MSEKAYQIDVTERDVELEIAATEDSPLYNPAFVLKNWNQTSGYVRIDGEDIEIGKDCRVGYRHSSTGIDLIVWIRMNRSNPVKISFEG
jgi:hypothetical protein